MNVGYGCFRAAGEWHEHQEQGEEPGVEGKVSTALKTLPPGEGNLIAGLTLLGHNPAHNSFSFQRHFSPYSSGSIRQNHPFPLSSMVCQFSGI